MHGRSDLCAFRGAQWLEGQRSPKPGGGARVQYQTQAPGGASSGQQSGETHIQSQLCEGMEMLNNLIVVIILYYTGVSSHHTVHLKLTYISIISQ